MVDLRIERIAARLLERPARVLPRDETTRTAAVAAILRPVQDDVEILLIRRADSPNDPWSGHMAFPGGRHDDTDEDLLATALRETREEVGLDLARVATPLGHLDEIEAISRGRRIGMVIRPYLFALPQGHEPELTANYEVAEVVWGRLGPLLRGDANTAFPYRYEQLSFDLPAFDVQGRIVWGLTYQMLHAFLERLRNDAGSST